MVKIRYLLYVTVMLMSVMRSGHHSFSIPLICHVQHMLHMSTSRTVLHVDAVLNTVLQVHCLLDRSFAERTAQRLHILRCRFLRNRSGADTCGQRTTGTRTESIHMSQEQLHVRQPVQPTLLYRAI